MKHGFTNEEIFVADLFNIAPLIGTKEYKLNVNYAFMYQEEEIKAKLQEFNSNIYDFDLTLVIDVLNEIKLERLIYDIISPFLSIFNKLIVKEQEFLIPKIWEKYIPKTNCKTITFSNRGKKFSFEDKILMIPDWIEHIEFEAYELSVSPKFMSSIYKKISFFQVNTLALNGFKNPSDLSSFSSISGPIKANEIKFLDSIVPPSALLLLFQIFPDIIKFGFIRSSFYDPNPSSLEKQLEAFPIPNSLQSADFIGVKQRELNLVKIFLRNTKNLRKLNLDQLNLIDNQGESKFSIFTWLQNIIAKNSQQTTSPSPIKFADTIEEISLKNAKINDEFYHEITQLPNLKSLDITGCTALSSAITIPEHINVIGQNYHRDFFPIDSDTKPSQVTLHNTRVFKPKPNGFPIIHLNDYRSSAYTEYDKVTGSVSFTAYPKDYKQVSIAELNSKFYGNPKTLTEIYETSYEHLPNYFLAKLTLYPGKICTKLPSLTPHDELIGIEYSTDWARISIQYCKKDNFYYCDGYTYGDYPIFYIIKSPYGFQSASKALLQTIKSYFYSYPPITELKFTAEGRLNHEFLYKLDQESQLQLVMGYFHSFKSKKLSRTPKTTKETIELILEEGAGVCRHGATALFAVLQELGIKSRLIKNRKQHHAYVEAFINGKWIKLHSGGGDPSLIENKFDDINGWPNELNDDLGEQQTIYARPGESSATNPGRSSSTRSKAHLNNYISFSEILKKFASNNPKEISKPLQTKRKLTLQNSEEYSDSIQNSLEDLEEEDEEADATYSYSEWIITLAIAGLYIITKELNFGIDLKNTNANPALDSNQRDDQKDYVLDLSSLGNYIPSLQTLILTVAATSSIGLMVMVAKYFYEQKQKKLKELESNNAKSQATPEAIDQPVPMIEKSEEAIVSIPLEANPFIEQIKDQLSKATSIEEYVDEIRNLADQINNRKNILCLMDRSQIEGFYSNFLNKEEDIYFISDLNEISLEDSVIIDGEVVQKDSKLARFIETGRGYLFIDWTKYQSNHIGYNSIIDKNRRIYELSLSSKMTVVSIADPSMGSDLHSRHKITRKLSPSVPPIAKEIPKLIDLDIPYPRLSFYSDDWQYYLLGRIKMDEVGYIYKYPKILDYLKSGLRNIILHNAPWWNREFRLKIEEIEHTGKIFVNGESFDCQGIRFLRNDQPFSLDGLELVEFNKEETHLYVSQENYQEVFERYHVNNQRKLIIDDQPTTDVLVITENLSTGQWAQLASIKAKVIITKEVDGNNAPSAPNFLSHLAGEQAQIIVTNDLGLAKKSYQNQKYRLIHIGAETTASDLFDQISYDQKTKLFDHDNSAMARLLLAEKEVVLVGSISQNLAKYLVSLFAPNPYMMLNGQRLSFTGKLTLITEENSALNLLEQQKQIFSTEDIWKEVREAYKSKDEQINKLYNLIKQFDKEFDQLTLKKINFSYTQICSMLNRMILKPYANPLKHILRLNYNYPTLKPILEKIWTKETQPVKPTKEEKLLYELANNKIVSMVGPSGAGKTTIMHSKIILDKYEIFQGIEHLDKLTEKSADARARIVFFDEANLAAKPEIYDILEAIYDDRGEVLIERKLLSFDPDARIVTANNYRYFKNRKDLKIINQHGSIISFKELDDQTLRSGVIEPILSTILPEESIHHEEISNLFIEAYHHINNLDPEKEFLTARNLEMMSFRYAYFHNKQAHQPHNLKAALAIYYEITGMLKKKERQNFKKWLESRTGVKSIKLTKAELKKAIVIDDFFVPRSWKNSMLLMEQMLAVQELKIQYGEVLKANGISAFLIEGEAGAGKSYRMIKFLEYMGYKDAALYPDAEKKYYLITPTDFTHAENTLAIAAKAEGMRVLVIDELNTMQLESPLNKLLSGYNLLGEKLKFKGLSIFASQNPITYSKRLALSDALLKRLQQVFAKDLDEAELIELVKYETKGEFPLESVKLIVKFYLKAVTYAKENQLPALNLRQLTDYLEEEYAKYLESAANSQAKASIKELKQLEASDAIRRYENYIDAPITTPALDSTTANPEVSVLDQFKEWFENYYRSVDDSFGPVKQFIANNYKNILFQYIYHTSEETIALQKILNKPYIKESTSKAIKLVLNKPLHKWGETEFRKLATGIHPDKYSTISKKFKVDKSEMTEDFNILQNYKKSFYPEEMANKLYQALTEASHHLSFFAKETDVVINLVKLDIQPNIKYAVNLGRDSLIFANKFYQDSKLGYVLPIFTSAGIIKDISNGEYWQAGTNAVHSFSHYFINNPLFSSYGTTVYGLLNGFIIGNDIYNGNYLAAATLTAGSTAMYLSPTVTIATYATIYTAQNSYELYCLVEDMNHQLKIDFNGMNNANVFHYYVTYSSNETNEILTGKTECNSCELLQVSIKNFIDDDYLIFS